MSGLDPEPHWVPSVPDEVGDPCEACGRVLDADDCWLSIHDELVCGFCFDQLVPLN